MKRIISFLTLCVAVLNIAFADPVDEQRAINLGNNFLSMMGAKNLQLKNLDSQHLYPNLYIFASSNSFVVMAADDVAHPVLGYSLSNPIRLSNMPSNLRFWLQSYNDEIAWAKEHGLTADEATQAEWELLYAKGLKPTKNDDVVEPLIETHWNQDAPYNDMCPYDEAHNDRAVTGCVATAMAQILRYWEYPARGNGSHSYEHPLYGTLSRDFSASYYDWYNMDARIRANGSRVKREAVALLMVDCGVAVDMDYNVSAEGGSGARTDRSIEAFNNNFMMRDATTGGVMSVASNFLARDNTSSPQWNKTLKNELMAGRPIFYVGYGDGAGHAWVCDGIDNRGYYHMNWGWGGYADGNYEMGALNPGSGGIGSGGSEQFNFYNHIIYNIAPPSSMLRVPADNIEVSVDGDSISLHVFAASSASNWSAIPNVSWIHMVQASGEGSSKRGNMIFIVDTNQTGEERTAKINVMHGAQEVNITIRQHCCKTITELPFAESFEGMTTSCWHTATVDGTRDSSFAIVNTENSIAEGECALQFTYSKREPNRRQYIISPRLEFGQDVELTFQYRRQWSYSERFVVLYSTTTDDPSSFIYYVGNSYMDNGDWNTFSGLIPAEARYVAVCYENIGSEGRSWSIDDIQFNATSQREVVISQLPYQQNFDTERDNWRGLSHNIENMSLNDITVYNQPHSPRSVFRFSAKYSTTDKVQYLISPRLSLGGEADLSFYYRHSGTGTDRFLLLYSTTGSTPDCFRPIGDTVATSSTEWLQHTAKLPADARYMAILYCPIDGKFLYIDDITIDGESGNPTAIDDVEVADRLSVSVHQRTINLSTDEPTDMYIYSIDGRLLHTASHTTHTSYTATMSGVYLVRTATMSARKIMVF